MPKRRYGGSKYGRIKRGRYGNYMVASRFSRSSQSRRNRALSRRNWRWGGALGVERKWYDSSVNAATIGGPAGATVTAAMQDPGGIQCLNAPVQGTSQTTRVGNKYNITSIQINGLVYLNPEANATAAEPAYKVTIAIVWDKQTNAAQMASEELWINPSGTAAGLANPLRNLLYSKRFKVLKQIVLTLRPQTMSYDGTNMEQGGEVAPWEYYHEFKKPVVVECRGNAGNVTDIVNHSFHVVATCNVEDVTTMFYNARVRFTDP